MHNARFPGENYAGREIVSNGGSLCIFVDMTYAGGGRRDERGRERKVEKEMRAAFVLSITQAARLMALPISRESTRNFVLAFPTGGSSSAKAPARKFRREPTYFPWQQFAPFTLAVVDGTSGNATEF